MSKTKTDIVIALAETFGRTLSAPAAKLYVAGLSCISDEEAKRAAAVAVQRCKFFPSAAELIEFAKTGGVSYEAKALIAFEELESALNANKPSLMSPLVAAIANQIGGFDVLRDMPLGEFNTWKRKDFISAYTSLVKENPERVLALTGPQSEIGQALGESLRLRFEEKHVIEDRNRKMLQSLPQEAR